MGREVGSWVGAAAAVWEVGDSCGGGQGGGWELQQWARRQAGESNDRPQQ